MYIWQADREKKEYESQIQTQQEQIAALESQIAVQPTPADVIQIGEVLGETTTATISGTIRFSKIPQTEAVIVCAREVRTEQEICVDFVLDSIKNEYDYTLDIPQGTYEVFALLPPSETKVYYSDITTCDDSGDCTSNAEKKRLLQVKQEETQSDVNLFL